MMFDVIFYESPTGNSDVLALLEGLRKKAPTNKDARIQYAQITRCIELLQENGTNLPVEVAKHLEGDIWELRPGNNRIFFFYCVGGTYVLLHSYRKKTQKTPSREIKRAMSEMKDYISRMEAAK